MQRRTLIATPAAAMAAATTAAGLLPPAQARPARAADFAARLPGQPLLAPFQGVTDATGQRDSGPLQLRGRWPEALRGRFYRNGPALMERAGERYHHWFDGDGMVQQFRIGDGQVTHRGRLVQTRKLQLERQAGRFLLPALGTQIEGALPPGGPDGMNVANTNALEHAGRVLAMWEGGSAYGLDPADLSTQGPVTWRADLQQVPFSAHPKVDAAGHLWNFGTSGTSIVVWHIDPQGALVRLQLARSPFPGGMAHDMAVTERHLVVPLPPVRLNLEHPVAGGGPRRFPLVAGEPLRVLVMEKADITRQRVFELPPQMVFHVGHAHEAPGGRIEFSFIGAPDTTFLDQAAVGLMAGQPVDPGPSTLQIAQLHLDSGRAELQAVPGTVEFPRTDPRRIGLPVRHLVSCASWPARPGGPRTPLMHGVQLLDLATGRARRFDYGDMAVAEEHILVPKPGRSGALDAWLLGTTYDARRQATVLNLLEAAHLEDGPVAQAILPYTLPLGFHGNFTAA